MKIVVQTEAAQSDSQRGVPKSRPTVCPGRVGQNQRGHRAGEQQDTTGRLSCGELLERQNKPDNGCPGSPIRTLAITPARSRNKARCRPGSIHESGTRDAFPQRRLDHQVLTDVNTVDSTPPGMATMLLLAVR